MKRFHQIMYGLHYGLAMTLVAHLFTYFVLEHGFLWFSPMRVEALGAMIMCMCAAGFHLAELSKLGEKKKALKLDIFV